MRMPWLLLLVPLLASAANPREDYAEQWPLRLSSDDAGAYRVELSEAIYRRAQSPTLDDIEPFNQAGRPLPATLLSRSSPLAAPIERRKLPLFALPPLDADKATSDLQLITERDASGAVTRVETRLGAGPHAGAGASWLVDASAIDQPLRGLWLDWTGSASVQAEVRVEGSDDLRTWHVIDAHAAVVDLQQGDDRIQQRRIALNDSVRYLRIVPVSGKLPTLDGVQAEVSGQVPDRPWVWVTLKGQPLERGYEYRLPGRFPVGIVDVVSPGNEAVEWIVQSRESTEASWVQRAGPWLAYVVGEGADAERSKPQPLSLPVRDRHWRLIPSAGTPSAAPTLRVGYRPETMVFLAQGDPPYALAAGSARAHRADAPLQPMLEALRRERGAQWQPAVAALARQPQQLGGDEALQPAPRKRDWKSWLLWSLLVLGALIVGGFAISLLRSGPSSPE